MRYYEVSNQEEFDQFLVELEKYIEEGKTEGIYLELLPNNYVTSKPIDIPSNFTLSGNNSEIRLVTEIEDWKYKGIIDAKGEEGETLKNIFIDNIKITTDKILGGEVLPKVRGISFDYVSDSNVVIAQISGARSYGIYLGNSSSNNVISGNTVTNNTSYGIYLYNSSNNVISGNTVTNNTSYGIYLYNSSNNVISGNTVTNNTRYGIYLSNSSSNVISGNTVTNNTSYGIYLYNSSSNVISGNTSTNNRSYGIYLSTTSSNNVISGNTSTNNRSYGIYLSTTSSNNVSYLNLTFGNGNGSYNNEGTDNDLSEKYNQFLEKAEG